MSKQRGQRGQGTVYRLRGGWQGQLDTSLGGRRTRRTFTGPTQEAVVAKLTAAAAALRRGAVVPAERQTFAQFVARWEEAARSTVRERTFEGYSVLLGQAVAELGRIRLARLAPNDLMALYDKRRAAGAAPATVLHLHRAVYRCLRDAERWGDVARNVARLVDAPKVKRHEMRALSAEEARALLRAAEGSRLEALLVVALSTGARLGEMLALSWDDVDLEQGAIAIRASLVPTPRGLERHEPKTARSRRRIEIEPRVVAALRRHKARQAEERFTARELWANDGYVFCDEIGRPLDGRTIIRTWFRPLLAKAGLPRVRIHDLRHSYASIALAQGVHPKVVQEALGHSTIAVTLDLYSHVVPSLQRDAARTMGAALFG